jgi:hypothetical protein
LGAIYIGIFGKIYSNDGSVLFQEFLINSTLPGIKSNPKICSLETKLYLVVWESNLQDSSGLGIIGRLINSNGGFLSTEFIINTSRSGDQKNASCAGLIKSSENSLSYLATKLFVVSYVHNDDIYAKIYDYSDLTNVKIFKEEFIVNSNTQNSQKNQVLEALNNGGFLISWESYNSNGSENDIAYQLFDSSGNFKNSETLANVFTYGDQANPSLAQLITGEIVISFDSVGDSDQTGVYYEFIINCPQKRFLDPMLFNRCSKCDFKCEYCSGTADNCSCAADFFLAEEDITLTKNCLSNSLISNYYLDSVKNLYKLCYLSCGTCSISKTNCLTCNVNANYFPRSVKTSDCVLQNLSPAGEFFNVNTKMHEKCDVSCSSCVNPSIFCLICNESLNYFPRKVNINNCYLSSASPNGEYFNLVSKLHEACDISCSFCRDQATNCSVCNIVNNYFPISGVPNKCLNINEKLIGYYFDDVNKIFNKCDIKCKSCDKTSTQCTQCNNEMNYYRKVGDLTNCFSLNSIFNNEYLDKTNPLEYTIKLCDTKCNSCLDIFDNCNSCNSSLNNFPIYDQVDNSKPSKLLI